MDAFLLAGNSLSKTSSCMRFGNLRAMYQMTAGTKAASSHPLVSPEKWVSKVDG